MSGGKPLPDWREEVLKYIEKRKKERFLDQFPDEDIRGITRRREAEKKGQL